MVAINHALTGAIIGLATDNPIVAVPAALASHFICDAIPHFGMGKDFITTRAFRNLLIADALLCVSLVLFLCIAQPEHWMLAALCAFIAASPDLLWIHVYRKALQGQELVLTGFYKFAADIQWFERPVGGIVEAIWFMAGVVLVCLLGLP